jgi:diacylglycerol kinase family enzyme
MSVHDIAIVFNPKGGSASAGPVNKLVSLLEARGCLVQKLSTTPEPGSATTLARSAASSGANLVIAFGGDGTICQVAEGLLGTNAAMAAYQGGTGNLFARTFNSKLSPEHFVKMVLDGQPQPVDMIKLDYVDIHGFAHARLFMTCFGIGPLSDSILVSQNVKRIFGKLAYVFGAVKASLFLKTVRCSLVLEEQGKERSMDAAIVAVANVLPPGMSLLSRGCNASDGLMDTTFLTARNFFELLPFAGWLPLGAPERSPHYGRLRTASLKIKTDEPVIPNIDGDASPATTELSLKVVPGAVKMVLI